MLDSIITWAGTSSNQGAFEGNIILKKNPDFNIPKRKIEVYNVPGRNGDVIVQQDAWENLQKQYVLFLKPNLSQRSLFSLCRIVARWLCEPTGYNVLQDNYEPNYFYLAYLTDKITIQNHLQRFGTATLTFSCRPEKFLTEGADETPVFTGRSLIGASNPLVSTITNPTHFASKPLLRFVPIDGEGEARIVINDTTIDVSEMPPSGSRGLILDCDTMNAYSGDYINRNNRISMNNDVFPVLEPGANTITVTGDINAMYITPRWWTI